MRFLSTVFLVILISYVSVLATDFSFLDIDRTGATRFIKEHPADNGRDVVVIILDTGVDMGTPGLETLPDEKVKVIDAQDFSGEGDVKLEKAETDLENGEKLLKNKDGIRLFGYDKLKYQPVDSTYLMGVLDEARFKNSVISDINNNGKKNDQFGLVAFKTKEGWLAYVDLDGDGNLDDEQPLWNYKEKLQSFHFRGNNPQEQRSLATFALNIFPDEKKVNFHFDGAGHGTHVAGIAAGYKINGQDGFNGVAPGAKVISLKIGDGRLAGGATRTGSMLKAYEYGVKFAKHYKGPVVFNMSFGIGSEIEGQSSMDLTLNDLLDENEKLLFCLSGGNEGPGLSSIGLPAAAARVLTVGAMNTARMARNLYGADLNSDRIFVFSSRGGELNKPDIITPGGAESTVPSYAIRDVMWGTSMASPQATGAVALIMSAAYHEHLPISGAMIKKAVKNSADPLPGYTPLDQGEGVINIPRAFRFYKKYVQAKEQEKILDYDISTVSPVYDTQSGPAAYWRFGTYFPTRNDKQRFYISAVFADKMTPEEQHNFYRAFRLKAQQPWIKINKSSTYIKGSNAAVVDVYFDPSKVKAPGLYSGKVIAYRKADTFKGKTNINKEFELLCSIIKPIVFDEAKGFQWKSGALKLTKGEVRRIFFEIPRKASAAAITLSALPSRYADIRAYLFDPEGRETNHFVHLRSKDQKFRTIRLDTHEMGSGTWELDVYADFRNTQKSTFKVNIAFTALDIVPSTIDRVYYENGSKPRGTVKVTNRFDKKVSCRIGGVMKGIRKVKQINSDSDMYEYSFSVSDAVEKVEFELELDKETFNLFTDFAINVKNYAGKVLLADGLTYRKQKMVFVPPSSGDYILELIPAFATKDAGAWQATLTESQLFFKQTPVSGGIEDFYPTVSKEIDFRMDGTLPVAPDGFTLFGELWLDSIGLYPFRTIVPIHLSTNMR